MSEEDEDKQHEPSPKKLEDARKKGEVPKSTDLTTAASYAGLILIAFTMGAQSLSDAGSLLAGMLEQSDRLSTRLFDGTATALWSGLLFSIIMALAAWFMGPAVLVLLVLAVKRVIIFVPSKLQPKLSRISILKNAKNKFGRSGLFEFSKSTGKLILFAALLWVFVLGKLPEITETMHIGSRQGILILLDMMLEFFLLAFLITVVIGGLDYLWQYKEHMRKNRMSHKELKDEMKQQEGDPHIKQQRRQKGYEIATNQMLAEVPSADVIIVNPTHFAVALKWDRTAGSAPICVAKGTDEIALKIREVASEYGVPIHSDPPTARALHASVELNQPIQPDHYQAVAVAIRFAESMRKKAPRK
ncbi:MAG: EscU/YscU/HrcU family type III secretion system export apparatus switch protein [Halocynthiibacter sp.]